MMQVFTVLLWNVAMTPTPQLGTRRARERAPHIAKIIAPFDIVVLNESFLFRNLLLSLTESSHPYVYTEPRVWYKFFNSGVVILSKIPLFHCTYKHYSRAAIWDWFVSKALVGCTFKVNGTSFDLFGTHLQAGSQRCAQSARARQTEEVVQHILETHNASHELILCGDFNCGPVFSGHYDDKQDADERASQYKTMVDGLGVSALLEHPGEDDISSFLVQSNSSKVRMKRIPGPSILVNQESMSDTAPLCIEISVCPPTNPATPVTCLLEESTGECTLT